MGDNMMTAEVFWKQYADTPYELVQGKVVDWQLARSFLASVTGVNILVAIRQFVEKHAAGVLTGAKGAYKLDKFNVRAPRVGFISSEKAQLLNDPYSFVPFAPDLSVEIFSSGDDEAYLQEKISTYLNAGTRLLWVVYMENKEVIVHRPDRTARTYTVNDTLDSGDVLPGFALPVANIFDRLP